VNSAEFASVFKESGFLRDFFVDAELQSVMHEDGFALLMQDAAFASLMENELAVREIMDMGDFEAQR